MRVRAMARAEAVARLGLTCLLKFWWSCAARRGGLGVARLVERTVEALIERELEEAGLSHDGLDATYGEPDVMHGEPYAMHAGLGAISGEPDAIYGKRDAIPVMADAIRGKPDAVASAADAICGDSDAICGIASASLAGERCRQEVVIPVLVAQTTELAVSDR